MTGLAEQLDLYANLHSPNQASIERFVLAHGREHPPGRLADELGPPRHCFWTAQMMAVGPNLEPQPGVTYVEGFALAKGLEILPIHHAWLIDESGAVVETTWADLGVAYYGVEFPDLHVFLETRGAFGYVLDEYAWRHHLETSGG